MKLSRKEAARLLGISLKTLQRRTKAGQYQATKTGTGQFAEVLYEYSGIGLPEPKPEIATPEPEPKPVEVIPPKPEPSAVDLKADEDRRFAEKYLAGQTTDSSGNKIDGSNDRFPSKGMQSLLGPVPKTEPRTPPSGTGHMQPELLGDYVSPLDKPLENPQVGTGFTRHGASLASGYSQEAYDADMRKWYGGPSEGEQEEARRRSKQAIRAAFPKPDRT